MTKGIAALKATKTTVLDKEITDLRASKTAALDKEVAGLRPGKVAALDTEITNSRTTQLAALKTEITDIRAKAMRDAQAQFAAKAVKIDMGPVASEEVLEILSDKIVFCDFRKAFV